jgi:t-SNARE complex subunit (syntaxin)
LKSAFTNASSSLSMSDRLTRLLFMSQLHTVKANLLLREELHEQTLTHERKLLSEAQEQQRRCIAEKNEDHDYLQSFLSCVKVCSCSSSRSSKLALTV